MNFKIFLSYFKSIFGVVATLALIVFVGTWFLLGSLMRAPSRRRAYQNRILFLWSQWVCKIFNISVEVRGEKNLATGGVLFLFNHTSHFDIPIFYRAIRKTARFGAKIELFKIPLFAQIMRVMGTLPIARHEREKVLQLYKESIDRVSAGESFVLAAEGTRQPRPGVGDSFKSGPLIFALSGQFEIQPLVFYGVYEILPRTSLFPMWGEWHRRVIVSILPSVKTEGLSLEDRDKLKIQLQNEMKIEYSRLASEVNF